MGHDIAGEHEVSNSIKGLIFIFVDGCELAGGGNYEAGIYSQEIVPSGTTADLGDGWLEATFGAGAGPVGW